MTRGPIMTSALLCRMRRTRPGSGLSMLFRHCISGRHAVKKYLSIYLYASIKNLSFDIGRRYLYIKNDRINLLYLNPIQERCAALVFYCLMMQYKSLHTQGG